MEMITTSTKNYKFITKLSQPKIAELNPVSSKKGLKKFFF